MQAVLFTAYLFKGIVVQQDRHITEGMVKSCSDDPDQKKVIEASFDCFFNGKDGVGIVLFAREDVSASRWGFS